jgi:hypothetical protein
MPAVNASREAAAKGAMANLSDAEVMSVLRAGAYLYRQLDGSPAEHVGYMLSYDTRIVARLTALLEAGVVPEELREIAREMVTFIAQE